VAAISLEGVTKIFDREVRVVNEVSLDVADGEFVVLVGPSGCGKSTLLRIVAGLEEATQGAVHIGDREVTYLPPKDRDIAMVFQNYALYPHMTVEQNIGFGLRLRKEPKEASRQRVREVAALLDLDELLDRKPGQLSGGQRQRVAMGRAMVREPQALLMDEPLSNLDAKLRVQMRAELNRMHQSLGTTTLYVTHDQIEAMTLGDRVAVLRDGVLQQFDTPHALFQTPVNIFVASFIGSPSMNLIDAVVERPGEEPELIIGEQRLPVPDGLDVSDRIGEPVVVGIRPTDFGEPHRTLDADWPTVDITVDVVEELGTEANVLFRLTDSRIDSTPVATVGRLTEADVLTATVDARTSIRSGDRARLTVDRQRIHLFDPKSGLTLVRQS
jgi:multiple sugar transport system ATP-binding protein